jgi:hypothetical protein
MTLGADLKTYFESLIDDANLRTQITFTAVTETASNFGYDTPSESTSTSTINSIPSNYVKLRTGLEKFGDLAEGEVRLLIKSGTSIDVNDRVTFDSQEYWIREVRPVMFNGSKLAQAIILRKKE